MINYYASVYSLFAPTQDIEESIDEKFMKAYRAGDMETAKSYLEKINVNYKNGHFLINIIRKDDDQMLKIILDKGASVGLANALGTAACDRRMKCVKILINYLDRIDSASLKEIINQGSHWQVQVMFANDARTRGYFDEEKLERVERKNRRTQTIPSTAPPLASSLFQPTSQEEKLITKKLPHNFFNAPLPI
jgi:hypothetical protein